MDEDLTRAEANDALDEALSALLDGELGAEEEARVRAEVAASPEAARRLARLSRLDDALRALPPPPLSADLHARLRACISAPAAEGSASAAPRRAPVRMASRRPGAQLAWIAGAALATAAGGALLFWLPRALTQAPDAEPGTSSIAAQEDPVEEFLSAAPAEAPEDPEVIELLDWLSELGDVAGDRG